MEAPKPDHKACKLLLVDDNATTRGMLHSLLVAEGFTSVREAGDGDAGLKMVAHFLPDVVCLDLFMPGKSGLEVLQEIHANFPSVGVLMITATSDRETVEACVRAGALGYIVKPFNAATVVAAIDRIMARRKHAG
ncbi:MAG: response regulator [Burkholderiales bacterium]|nr:response regulator [Burkholderiales bacterium]